MAGKRSEIGKMFARWRIDNEKNVADFAEIVGVSQPMISKVEWGHDTMPPHWLGKLPADLVEQAAEELRRHLTDKYNEAIAQIDASVKARSD